MIKSNQDTIILCNELCVGYGGPPVLSSLNLAWKHGSGPLAFCGANGTGKSTLMKACLGLLKPACGSILVLDSDPVHRHFRKKLRNIGYTPQQRPPGLLRLSVRELVSMGRAAALKPLQSFSSTDTDAIDHAMELCAVDGLSDMAVQELSGGQFQRSAIARAMAMEPELLFLDEPTTFLDKESRRSVVKLLEKLVLEQHTELVLISHDRALLELCSSFWSFGSGSAVENDREQVLSL